jgi:hypothetical protein
LGQIINVQYASTEGIKKSRSEVRKSEAKEEIKAQEYSKTKE